ncbi:MAG: hypothetical protein AB1Z67_04645 [Candidatus Limnocylindrales bacterium]
MPITVPAATSDTPVPGPSDDQATAAERTADARLARVHLRGGLVTLARATLEGMAGAGTLDREAMADLAEVRWRSGDLEGAAEAARAHQASGGDEPLAALIIAEDMAQKGEEAEAEPIARSLSERLGGAVDVLFALEPRSSIWAPADEGWMAVGATEPGRWGLLVGGSEVAEPTADTWPLQAIEQPVAEPEMAPLGRGAVGQPGGAASTGAVVMSGRIAGEELEIVDHAIAAGDIAAAVSRLGVLLRLDPALAPIILSSADRAAATVPVSSRHLSAIHLVRGDAYRNLGRENEAAAAYQAAHQALSEGPPSKEPT